MEGVRNVLKVSELNKSERTGTTEELACKIRSVGWGFRECGEGMEKFRDIVEWSNDVYGMRRVGCRKRKGIEEVGVEAAKKQTSFKV